jgi:hypothetical protein
MVLTMVKLRQKGEMVLQLTQKEGMRRKMMAHPFKRVVRLKRGKKIQKY